MRRPRCMATTDPTLTFTVGGPNGLANNAGIGVVDSNATVFSGSLTRVAGETVVAPGPTYAISQGSLAANGNYSVTSFTNSNLTIQPRTITLTADAQTKMYGNNDPTLTFTVGRPQWAREQRGHRGGGQQCDGVQRFAHARGR